MRDRPIGNVSTQAHFVATHAPYVILNKALASVLALAAEQESGLSNKMFVDIIGTVINFFH